MSSAALPPDARCDSDGARKRPRYLHPECAKRHGGRCQLLQHRCQINEFLLLADLELCEDGRGRSGGDARLAVTRKIDCRFVFYSSPDDQRESLNVARGLLLEHRCITAVELSCIAMNYGPLLAALERNDAVKSLTLWLKSDDVIDASLFMLTDTLSRLDELIFMDCFWYKKCKSTIWVECVLLEENVAHLTTLNVAHLAMTEAAAARFILALVQSQTIADLTIGRDVMYCNDGRNFSRYLTKQGTSLKKLTYLIKSTDIFPFSRRDVLERHVNALCRMTTLEELNFDFDDADADSARYCATYAKLVSPSLRRLWLPRTPCREWVYDQPSWDNSECMELWLTALRKRSKLNELRIDLWCFAEPQCLAFFEAVADNATLRHVVVRHLPVAAKLDAMCSAIRQLGLSDRVVVEDQYYCYRNMWSLRECTEIAGVTIRKPCASLAQHAYLEDVRATFEVLSRIRHRISLRVDCDGFDVATFAALTALIRSRSALAAVELDMEYERHDVQDWQRRDAHASEVLSALASNPNLTRVSIYGLPPRVYDCLHVLATSARKNRNLVHVCITPLVAPEAFSSDFGSHGDERKKASRNYENFVLVNIQKATRRNASRVMTAAGFVLRRQDSEHGARYLETMHDHPWLLELVREGAAVSNGEAKAMVSEAFKAVRCFGLDEFMRMAGVVRSKVECVRPRRTEVQLADIGVHCWLHIRQYLKLEDIM
ncbi:uncharacterized protein LOC142589655 [Dermacentor variabilis]|uniref:uncharacterized protein LOC142589655 n=1 Tax=Dermacentor variabilis TaxID=34621 RepID=UPI003F5BC54B